MQLQVKIYRQTWNSQASQATLNTPDLAPAGPFPRRIREPQFTDDIGPTERLQTVGDVRP